MKFKNHIFDTYHRMLIEKLLKKYNYLIKGNILDIGSKNRRYDYLFNGKITAIDIEANPEFNVIKGDLKDLQFDDNSFESIICLEVFHYLDPIDCKKGFEEIYRVLRKGGWAIVSICFVYHEDSDNYRLTYEFIEKLLTQINNIKFKILRVGNRYTSIYDIIREKIKRSNNKFKNLGPLLICFILYSLIKIFGLENKEDKWPEGYFIILNKR